MRTVVRDTVLGVFGFDYCMIGGADGVDVVGGKDLFVYLLMYRYRWWKIFCFLSARHAYLITEMSPHLVVSSR